jgi:hypothetical protein
MLPSTDAASERGHCEPSDCYNDYASGLTAPTSRTTKTFAGPLAMSRIKLQAAGWRTLLVITIAFSQGQKAARNGWAAI